MAKSYETRIRWVENPFTIYSMTFFWFYYTQEKICKRNNDALTTDIVGLYRFTFFYPKK